MLSVPVYNQVRVLVANLSKKTFKNIDHELKGLIGLYGEDTRQFFLRSLLDDIDFDDHKASKDHLKIQLVNQELLEIVKLPNFVTLLCRSIDTQKLKSEGLISHFCKVLKLPLTQQFAIGLALTHVEDNKVANEGKNFLMSKFPEISETTTSRPPPHLLHKLSIFLQTQKDLPDKKRDQYLKFVISGLDSNLYTRPLTDKLSTNTQDTQTNGKRMLEDKAPAVPLEMLMRDLGPSCLETKEKFKKVLTKYNRMLPEHLARVIGLIIRKIENPDDPEKLALELTRVLEMRPPDDYEKDNENVTEWNISVFVETIQDVLPLHIWPDVYQKFDFPEFFLPDERSFRLLVKIFQKGAPNATFPLDPFLREWKNKVGQLSFIRHAVMFQSRPGFFSTSNRLLGSVEGIDDGKSRSNWCSLDLMDSLLNLGNSEEYNSVWEILRIGLLQEPELVLLSTLHLKRHLDSCIGQEILIMSVPQIYWEFPSSKPLIHHLWKNHKDFVVESIVDQTKVHSAFLPKVFEIAQDLKALDSLIGTSNLNFNLHLASLAASRNALDLGNWLKIQITKHQGTMTTACLEYLRGDSSENLIEHKSPEKVILLSSLYENQNLLSPQEIQELKPLQDAHNISASVKGIDSNSADVEKEAHLYFKQIYEGKISLEEVVDTLKNFKASKNPRENEMFMCMIHALFDEYRFFSQYPEKELRITAVLFGLLIKHRLVSGTTLGIALRYVLDALQKKPDSNVFQFGMWALEQFKERLHQWPQYCALIVENIPDLRRSYPELVSYIESAASENPSGISIPESSVAEKQNGDIPPNNSETSTLSGKETGRPDTTRNGRPTFIEPEKKENLPPEAIRDKIHFLINNLSKANVSDKVSELMKFMEPPHFEYFSKFLVTKRVVQEANHLKMYASFLEEYGNKNLYKVVIEETYANIKSVLGSDKIIQSFDERKLLKNLGSWLGLMTLARNKPVLAKKLRLKELVIRAYGDGGLIAVVPFVAKVLEPTIQSKIFKLPNPWLMGMLGILREIMVVDNLKLNLKFAIECLFNHLQIEVQDVKPTEILEGIRVHPGNLKPVEVENTPPASVASHRDEVSETPQTSADKTEDDAKDSTQFVKIHPSIPLFQKFPDLKRCVPLAVDKAIQDIIPVVERSVQIACVTTRQLIMKDFAMEPDHNVIRGAAHQMVRKLTSSLALVTCKDPLRVSISSNLASRLEEALPALEPNLPDRSVLEHACVQVSADNLDLGCKLVEKAASDRAVFDIDEILAAFYLRKRQGPPYPSSFPVDLPLDLKPKSNGELSSIQMRVYEDFGSATIHPDVTAAAKGDVKEEFASKRILPESADISGRQIESSIESPPSPITNQTVLDNLTSNYASLKKAIFSYPDAKDTALTALPKSQKAQEIHKIVSLFPTMLRAAREENMFPREVMFLTFANKVFKELFSERTNALTISSQCAVLKCIVAVYPAAIERMSEWLFSDERERKFIKPVITALIGNHLLDTSYIDEYLRKLMISNLRSQHADNWRELERTIDLSITLVRDLVVKEQVLPPESFRGVIEVFLRLPSSVSAPFDRSIKMLFEGLHSLRPETSAKLGHNEAKQEVKNSHDMNRFRVVDLPTPVEEPEQQGLRQSAGMLLDDWLTICLQGTVSDKTYAQYLQILRNEGLLQTTKSTNLFFRIITELCINYTSKSQNQSMSYTTIDALAKLVVFLVKFLDNTNKIALLSAFLQVAAHVLIRDHNSHKVLKSGLSRFNQKPYLRLFTNLLYDLNTPDPSLDSSNIEVLNAFTHALHKLRPARCPAFAFAWMELVSHRMFMPKLLISKPHRCSIMFKTLIVDLLEFLKPYLQNADLLDQVRLLYRGTLRILLVLLHDFPEFLCEFHFSFCDAIPSTCIQMRNLILSAFPRNVRLPDPLTPNLKVDLLPEITHPPRIGCDVTETLIAYSVLSPLEQYLATRQPPSLPMQLCEKLQSADAKYGSKYDVKLVNSLVLHVGMQGIAKLQAKNEEGIVSQFQDNSCMDIFERLVGNLDPEGRYYVLNAIANQLRYPNNHTHYFSCVLLYLFLHSEEMFIKEQITRVLLERLIVHQPHPWGLLITFIELIKNPQYEFSRQPFTNCAPEIQRLFDSVTRSCMPAKEEGSVHVP